MFPLDCIFSQRQIISDGRSVEVATIGDEGIVGLPQLLGGQHPLSPAIVHAPGWAYRLDTRVLDESFHRCRLTGALLLRYLHLLYIHIAQNVACAHYHPLVQRLSRRLLAAADRGHTHTLPITHDSLAEILGVRRETVTEALGKLQTLGLLNCRRGIVTILDRSRLKRECCDCYAVAQQNRSFDRGGNDVTMPKRFPVSAAQRPYSGEVVTTSYGVPLGRLGGISE